MYGIRPIIVISPSSNWTKIAHAPTIIWAEHIVPKISAATASASHIISVGWEVVTEVVIAVVIEVIAVVSKIAPKIIPKSATTIAVVESTISTAAASTEAAVVIGSRIKTAIKATTTAAHVTIESPIAWSIVSEVIIPI